MTRGNHERVRKAFDPFKTGRVPFVDREFERVSSRGFERE